MATFSSSVTAADRRILLVEPQPSEAKAIAKVIRPIASKVEILSSVDNLQSIEDVSLVIANCDALEEAGRRALVDACKLSSNPGRLLMVSSTARGTDYVKLFGDLGLTNLLAKNPMVDAEELLVTVQKLVRKDIFGLEKYFPWGTPTSTLHVRRSADLSSVLDRAREFASALELPSRMRDLFTTVVEELTLNALYDAPVDEEAKPTFASVERCVPIELSPDQVIDVTFACDGRRLGVAVVDPFGSLTVESVLSYLTKCFRRGDDQLDEKKGGAGLGLYYVFESLSHLVINLRRGARTEMIGLMDIRGTYRDFVQRSKSFNVFVDAE